MTPEREAKLETLPPEVASETEWQIYKQRNDSFIVDLFQGQYRNRLECLTCHKVRLVSQFNGADTRHRRRMTRSCTCRSLCLAIRARWLCRN